jgi:hypothetical protein
MATINGLKDEDPDDEDATRSRSWLKKSSPSLSSETLRTLAKWFFVVHFYHMVGEVTSKMVVT